MKLLRYWKQVLIILFFVITYFLNLYVGRTLIPDLFPIRPVVPDLAIRFLPYWSWAVPIEEWLPSVLIFTFILLLILNKFKNWDKYILGVSIMYFLRACAIIMTPMGASWTGFGNRLASHLANPTSDVNGYFFSGHTAMSVLLWIYISEINPKLRWIAFVVMVLEIVLIVMGKAHYLIDIYGGIVTSLLIGYWLKILPLKKSEDLIEY